MHTIGIDTSKDTLSVAFTDNEVAVFRNTEQGIKALIEEMIERGCTTHNTLLGTEATGVYHLLLCEKLRSFGWNIKVINPLITHRVIDSSLRRLKTDYHDAIAVRKTLLSGAGYSYTDTPEIQTLKMLVQERYALSKIKASIKHRIEVRNIREKAIGFEVHNSYKGPLKLIAYEIREIEKKMAEYSKDTQTLLQSIPGIGKVSSAALVAYIGDIRRFSSPEKLVAYIGLDARVHESGTSIHGKGFISKRGNSYLRHVLFNAAFIAKHRNSDLGAYMQKKISEGKHYFSAMCAVERKLVHIIYAVWSRGTPFEKR